MSFWVLIQVLINIVLLAAVAFLWFRLNRPAKDDPRLSKGLQLLQSKISILEDLADRSDQQANQLTALLEQKCRELQNSIFASDKQLQKIEAAMAKSLEVAHIFQDKIPHQEIIERQNTVKYVKAARMAHQGHSLDDISQQVDLSRGELEMIVKLNREQLQFSEEDLPQWVREESLAGQATNTEFSVDSLFQATNSSALQFEDKSGTRAEMNQLGEKFRSAMSQPAPTAPAPVAAPAARAQVNRTEVKAEPAKTIQRVEDINKGTVRKVVFPKIEINKNLI